MSRGERFSAHSKMGGVEIGLRRVSEVIFVCVVALAGRHSRHVARTAHQSLEALRVCKLADWGFVPIDNVPARLLIFSGETLRATRV